MLLNATCFPEMPGCLRSVFQELRNASHAPLPSVQSNSAKDGSKPLIYMRYQGPAGPARVIECAHHDRAGIMAPMILESESL